MDQRFVDSDVLYYAAGFFAGGVVVAAFAWLIAYIVIVLQIHHAADNPLTRGVDEVFRRVSVAIGLNAATSDRRDESSFVRLLRSHAVSVPLYLFWLAFAPAMILWAAGGYQSAFAAALSIALGLSAARFFGLSAISENAAIIAATLSAAVTAMFIFTVPQIEPIVSPVRDLLSSYFIGLADLAQVVVMALIVLVSAAATWLAGQSAGVWGRGNLAAASIAAAVMTLLHGTYSGKPTIWILPYVGAVFTFALVLLTYVVWRWDSLDRRNRLSAGVARVEAVGWRERFGLNGEMIAATGVLAALPLLLVARLDGDFRVFEGAGDPLVYVRYVLGTLLDTLPIRDVIEWLIGALGLQWSHPATGYPRLPEGADYFAQLLVRFGSTIVVALVALGGVIALYGKLVTARIKAFEHRLRRMLKDVTTPPDTVFAEAQQAVWRGPNFASASTGVADRMITEALATRSQTPQHPHELESLHPSFLGYLMCAWQGDVQLRQRFLRTSLRLIGERLDRLLQIVDPPFVNHLALTEGTGLGEVITQLRASRAQWSSGRAPLNTAAITNWLAVELSRVVENRWRLDDPDYAELVGLLNEAETLLQEAMSAFEQTWSAPDAAAVNHNLATVQYLLALVRRDASKLDQAIEHFGKALSIRDPQAIGVFAQSADLMIDAAASHAFCALAHGQRASWSGEDSYAFRAAQHGERAVTIYGAESGRLVGASDNHVAALVETGKLACTFAAWETAIDCFQRALTGARRAKMPAVIVANVRLRLGYAAVRAAHDALAHNLFGQESHPAASLPVLERAQRNLRHARSQIAAVAEPKELRALIRLKPRDRANSRHDFMARSLLLLAGAKCWVWNEFQLVQAADDETSDGKDTASARLAAEGLAYGDHWSSKPTLEGEKPGITDKNNAIVEADSFAVRELVTRLNRDWGL